MYKAIDVSRAEHEAAAELKRIQPDPVLPMPGRFGSRTRLGIIAAKYMEDIGAFQFRSAVGPAVFVDEQWEVDSGVLAEFSRKVGVAQSDRSQ